MNTVILRTITPFLAALMFLFSVFVLLRGHNEPGGGFIGGLIAASALATYGIAYGVGAVRRALYFEATAIAGFGVLLAGLSGLVSVFFGKPFLTGFWVEFYVLGAPVKLSNILVFDVGVYLAVVGTVASIALNLEEPE